MFTPLKKQIRRAECGFTLIELLTVIAVVSILAGILFTGISRARSSAQQTKSLSNIRQVVQLLLVYAQENDGSLPYGQTLGSFSYFNRDMMKPYIGVNDPIWFCPVMIDYYERQGNFPINSPERTWKGRLRTSWHLTGGGAAWYNNTGRENPSFTQRGVRIDSFVRPSESFLIANLDTQERGGYDDNYANVGYADGSVRRVEDFSHATGNRNAALSVYSRYWLVKPEGIIGYDY